MRVADLLVSTDHVLHIQELLCINKLLSLSLAAPPSRYIQRTGGSSLMSPHHVALTPPGLSMRRTSRHRLGTSSSTPDIQHWTLDTIGGQQGYETENKSFWRG